MDLKQAYPQLTTIANGGVSDLQREALAALLEIALLRQSKVRLLNTVKAFAKDR
jgi:hypothetical protein